MRHEVWGRPGQYQYQLVGQPRQIKNLIPAAHLPLPCIENQIPYLKPSAGWLLLINISRSFCSLDHNSSASMWLILKGQAKLHTNFMRTSHSNTRKNLICTRPVF